MKILIADDELVSRSKLHEIMQRIGKAEAVESGNAALAAFREAWEAGEPFDLVMLDINMPDVCGLDVLYFIRETEKRESNAKRTKVLMVTVRSDKDTVITSFQAGSDGFIVKPFDRKIIENKLVHIGMTLPTVGEGTEKANEAVVKRGTIRAGLSKIVQQFRKGEIKLPIMPDVVLYVEKVVRNPDATIGELSQVIERDSVISARLIATANSPFYLGRDSVRSVRHAIDRLGFKEAQKIVVAIANVSLYRTSNKGLRELMEKMRVYSLASAYAASQLARKLGIMDAEKYFMLGMIHELGSVLLLSTLCEVAAQDVAGDLNEVMQGIHDLHHTFGAALLERWKFSEEFIEVVRMHEGPDFTSDTAKEVLIINLAGNLASKMGYNFYDRQVADISELVSAKLLQIDSAALSTVIEEVTGLMAESCLVFSPAPSSLSHGMAR